MKLYSITDASSLLLGFLLLLQAPPSSSSAIPLVPRGDAKPFALSTRATPASNTCEYVQSLQKRDLPQSHTLHKRGYRFGRYTTPIVTAHRAGMMFPEVKCKKGEVRSSSGIQEWPGGNRGGLLGTGDPLAYCFTTTVECAEDGRSINVEDCPKSDDELLDRLVESGKFWTPPLTREEAKCGLDYLERQLDSAYGKPISASLSVIMTPPPGPTQSGVYGGCREWHVAQSGDCCSSIAEKYNVALGKFYEYNPAVNEGGECQGLWIGYSYCIKGL